jgi:8-oxo-dGTP pyrophosphatase MutT (NUDIX family)
VIPVRRTGDSVQVCVIRRRDSRAWSIPKGFIDADDTREQAAMNEAHEEAGLIGHLLGECIGTYDYRKWDAHLTVAVYVMEVLTEESTWPEMRFRERRWCSLDEAVSLLMDHPVRRLLDHVNAHLATAAALQRPNGPIGTS